MRFFKSIRWQLQLWHGLLLLAVLCAFGFTACQLEKLGRIHAIDEDIQRRLSLLVSTLRAAPRDEARRGRPDTSPPPVDHALIARAVTAPELKNLFAPEDGYYYVIWMRGPEPLASSANAPGGISRPTEHEEALRLRAGEFRESFIFAAPVDCVLVGRSIAEVNSAIRRHALLLSVAGGLLLGMGLAIGWWLTNRALKPVRDISATATRIAGGDLSQRINASDTESELGALVTLLNATFARLDAAFSQQARFTSDAAHELRTPLTVLLTQTQAALSRERSAGEYRDTLLANQAAAQRMRRLVEDLLELARLEAGQEPLRREPCDLAVIAADCAELVQPLVEAQRISLTLELSRADCNADPARIAQVMTNLLKNAIDHNRDEGRIHVATAQRDDFAVFEVSNHGAGIADEHLPHIFERFYRADPARSAKSSNAGLGLAISKAIIDAHGGQIDVSSNAQVEAVFRVILPSS